MKTHATVTGPKGKVQLTFGVYGLKNFCKRLGCEPTIFSIMTAFQGGTRLEAISEIIRSGIEQTSADKTGAVEPVTDIQACAIVETALDSESDTVMKAFFSSIIGEDYDQWFDKLTLAVENKEAADEEEETDEKKSTSAPAGTKSKLKPTGKSD